MASRNPEKLLFDRFRALYDGRFDSDGFNREHPLTGLLSLDKGEEFDNVSVSRGDDGGLEWSADRFRRFEPTATADEALPDPNSNPMPTLQSRRELKDAKDGGMNAMVDRYATKFADAPPLSPRNGGMDMLKEVMSVAKMPDLPQFTAQLTRGSMMTPQAGMMAPQQQQMPMQNFLQPMSMQMPSMDLGQIVSMLLSMGKNTGGNR